MKKIITIEVPLLNKLTKRGNNIRRLLDKQHIFSLNIMASPGAGKTSLILRTIEQLSHKYRIAVVEGDIVPIDVEKIQKLNIPVVLAHTGGACHLDSVMMEVAIKKLDIDSLDLLIVENVGNLICPAEFYLGTHKNVVIASVPEGDDKPYKYPTMFQGADIVILNKSDYLKTELFDLQNFTTGLERVMKEKNFLLVSSRTGEGIVQWIKWIEKQMIVFSSLKIT